MHRQTDAGRQLTVVLTAESRHERSAVSCELIFELKGRIRYDAKSYKRIQVSDIISDMMKEGRKEA